VTGDGVGRHEVGIVKEREGGERKIMEVRSLHKLLWGQRAAKKDKKAHSHSVKCRRETTKKLTKMKKKISKPVKNGGGRVVAQEYVAEGRG